MASRKNALQAAAGAVLLFAVSACMGAGSGGDADLTYWSMWKVGEPQQKVMAKAVADFEKETGLDVDVQWQGRNNLQKLVPTLNTNSVPDLVDGPYVKAVPALVATNQAHALGAAYARDVEGSTVSELIPKKYLDTIDIKLSNGQPWMLPYQITSDAVWYNAAEHPEIKKNPPATWDEWIAAMNKIKGSGEAPLAADGDVAGYNAYYFTTLLLREDGPGALEKVAKDKSGQAWRQPDVLAAAEKVEQLVDGGYLIKGYRASKFPAQQQKWANNKAAFLFMGSWLPTESSTYAAEGFDYASFPFPTTGSHKSMRVDFSGFMVPKKADDAEAAQKFAAFFLRKEYQDAWGAKAKVIPIREDAKTSPEMAGIQKSIKSAKQFHQQNDGVAFPGYNEKVFWPNSDKLFLGDMSAKEFVDAMAEDQARYWRNQS